jgi:phenylacetic acid degradation protein paaN
MAWRKAGPEAWVGVSLEILTRINKRSFEIAHAVMHTTGQAFVMSFQAGCPHAQDRALEAIAYAWDEMRRIPAKAYWEKPQGKNEPLKMEKHYRIVPRGIRLDRLQHVSHLEWIPRHVRDPRHEGNAVMVKPHPNAILPLAITVQIARGAGRGRFDPELVTLIAHAAGDDTAQTLATAAEVKLIDFTGSTANGDWLEQHARQAQVYTEKAASIRSCSTPRTTSRR